MSNIDQLVGVKSFDEFKEKIESSKIDIEKLVKENMVDLIINVISNLNENDARDCYVHLAASYCDGTEEKYNEWRKYVTRCIKSIEVPKKQKEILELLD